MAAVVGRSTGSLAVMPISEEKWPQLEKELVTLIENLHSINIGNWAGYFERALDCVRKRDVECLVRARDAVPFATSGGFGDFLENHPSARPLYVAVERSIGDLKLLHRYSITRAEGHDS